MDRLESMAAFVSVARAGGFSAASRELGIPLATISRRVGELETALGVRLLRRSTRQVVVTEAGQRFFVACQRALEDLRDAEEAVGSEYRTPRGDLLVTAPVAFGRLHLQPVALDFLAAHPQINLRMQLVDRIVNIADEHIDAALRIAHLPDSGLTARALGSIRVLVCASPAYLRARGAPQRPEDLTQHDCIAWSILGPRDTWWFRDTGRERQYPIRTRLATTLAESAIDAATAGLGLVQTTSYQASQAIADGRLVVVLRKFECAVTPVSLVYARDRLLPLRLRAFLDFVAPRVSERLRSVADTVEAAGRGRALPQTQENPVSG
jgi:DNA-binding transcriptional LysR family regulator